MRSITEEQENNQDERNFEIQPSGMNLSFDRQIACLISLDAAIIYNHILYWLRINADRSDVFIDGKYWMYETQKKMAEFFGFMSEDRVYKAIKDLVKHGLLLKENFNKSPMDKTNWYTVSNQSLIKDKVTKRAITESSRQSAGSHRPGAGCIYNDKDRKDKDITTVLSCPADEIKKISKKGKQGIPFEVSKSDLFSMSVQKRKDWQSTEINEVWQIIVDYPHQISDLEAFCDGVIHNLRQDKNIKTIKTKEKQCTKNFNSKPSNKPQESSKKETSTKDTSVQPLVNLGALLEKRKKS